MLGHRPPCHRKTDQQVLIDTNSGAESPVEFFQKKNWRLWGRCPRSTGNQSHLVLDGTKWILMRLGFSRIVAASSLVLTPGTVRATQCLWASWNLVGTLRSVVLSEQVVTALVRHLRAVHGLRRHSRSVSLRRCSSLGCWLVPPQIVLYFSLAADSLQCCSGWVVSMLV